MIWCAQGRYNRYTICLRAATDKKIKLFSINSWIQKKIKSYLSSLIDTMYPFRLLNLKATFEHQYFGQFSPSNFWGYGSVRYFIATQGCPRLSLSSKPCCGHLFPAAVHNVQLARRHTANGFHIPRKTFADSCGRGLADQSADLCRSPVQQHRGHSVRRAKSAKD